VSRALQVLGALLLAAHEVDPLLEARCVDVGGIELTLHAMRTAVHHASVVEHALLVLRALIVRRGARVVHAVRFAHARGFAVLHSVLTHVGASPILSPLDPDGQAAGGASLPLVSPSSSGPPSLLRRGSGLLNAPIAAPTGYGARTTDVALHAWMLFASLTCASAVQLVAPDAVGASSRALVGAADASLALPAGSRSTRLLSVACCASLLAERAVAGAVAGVAVQRASARLCAEL
jgi:hypothetical protein